jgi:hypothetical protein
MIGCPPVCMLCVTAQCPIEESCLNIRAEQGLPRQKVQLSTRFCLHKYRYKICHILCVTVSDIFVTVSASTSGRTYCHAVLKVSAVSRPAVPHQAGRVVRRTKRSPGGPTSNIKTDIGDRGCEDVKRIGTVQRWAFVIMLVSMGTGDLQTVECV